MPKTIESHNELRRKKIKVSQLIQKISKCTFLIVDDQDFLCSVLADLMRGFGAYDSHSAKNGAHAIEMMAGIKPDIIFTDLNMEPVNGFELTQWVRRSPKSPNPEIPIIMLTGSSDLETIYTARDYGVSELIIKPVVPKQVLSRLHAVLEEPRKFIRSKNYIGPDRRRSNDKKYSGPLRRSCDPMQIKATTEAAKNAEQGIRTLVFSLVKIVSQLDPKNHKSPNQLLGSISALKHLAIESDNAPVAKAIWSLENYVTAMGLNGQLRTALLQEHLECIALLSDQTKISEQETSKMIRKLTHSVSQSLTQLSIREHTS